MPLSSLSPIVTARFGEVSSLLSEVTALESSDPLVPDSETIRSLRGLLYVHMYAAFEFAMSQSFIRLAQHVSARNVKRRHLQLPVYSAALDPHFEALRNLSTFEKRFRKRIETIGCTSDAELVTIKDDILSPKFQSASTDSIALAFAIYGIPGTHLYDVRAKGYIDEVVERRHAVAHGRESAADVGVTRTAELRKRHDALYKQSIFIIDTLNNFCNGTEFVQKRFRRFY